MKYVVIKVVPDYNNQEIANIITKALDATNLDIDGMMVGELNNAETYLKLQRTEATRLESVIQGE